MAVRRIVAGTLATLLLPAVLTGCGGDSSVADPSVQSSPSSAGTSDPPARETPEHFIRRWAAVEKRMENTGKTKAYLALSKQCRSCRQLASDIDRFYAAGGFANWSGWRIIRITGDGSRGSSRIFDVKVESGPTNYRESSTSPVEHLAGGPSTHQVSIQPTGSSWRVVGKVQIAR